MIPLFQWEVDESAFYGEIQVVYFALKLTFLVESVSTIRVVLEQ